MMQQYKRHGVSAVLAFISEKRFFLIIIVTAVVAIILFWVPGVLMDHSNSPAIQTIPPVVAEPTPTATSTATATPTETSTPSPSPTPVTFDRVLKYTKPNMQGDDVWRLQEKLGLKPDGYFGQSTAAAVIKFQLKHGLNGDGVVGDETLKKLGLK